MHRRIVLPMTLVIVMATALSALAAPRMVNYQGTLLDTNGDPVTSATSVAFAIWSGRTTGVQLWSESQMITPDATGLFSTLLGTVAPIPDSAFADSAFLAITVGSDPEMSPRTELVSVPFSYRVGSVEGALGGQLRSSLSFSDSLADFGEKPMMYLWDPAPAGPATRPILARSPSLTSMRLVFNTSNEAFEFQFGGPVMTIEMSNHRVGIGTASPSTDFEVAGVVKGQVAEFGVSTTRTGFQSAVGGGSLNNATANWATTAGGQSNSSSAQYATVSGGQSNTSSGTHAIVPGGELCEASGSHSFAAGLRAKAIHDGAHVWADNTVADFSSERANQFRVRADGGLKVDDGTEWLDIRDDATDLITTSTGAHLTLGGAWTNSSDRNLKENFSEIDRGELLARVAALPITEWNYKAERREVRHIGPTAQDFFAAFGVGTDDRSISTIDPAGIALAAIQELYKRNGTLEAQNAQLQAELAELRDMIETLTKRR